jgi:broad specificity phosphatase PhoE
MSSFSLDSIEEHVISCISLRQRLMPKGNNSSEAPDIYVDENNNEIEVDKRSNKLKLKKIQLKNSKKKSKSTVLDQGELRKALSEGEDAIDDQSSPKIRLTRSLTFNTITSKKKSQRDRIEKEEIDEKDELSLSEDEQDVYDETQITEKKSRKKNRKHIQSDESSVESERVLSAKDFAVSDGNVKAFLKFYEESRPGAKAKLPEHFYNGIQNDWGPSEIDYLNMKPTPTDSIGRVIAIRHGMGFHNQAYGTHSYFQRDAELNTIGIEQSKLIGSLFRNTTKLFDLDSYGGKLAIVVSPFTRTLKTLIYLMGCKSWHVPTIIQPLCAEHTLEWSVVQQGDRGTSATKLKTIFPAAEYPQFDFSKVDKYCSKLGITNGQWWHHGLSISETEETFKLRTIQFKLWLAKIFVKYNYSHILVVSHGGFLRTSFNQVLYDNTEFRIFDLQKNGAYIRDNFAHAPFATVLSIDNVASGREKDSFQIVGTIRKSKFIKLLTSVEIKEINTILLDVNITEIVRNHYFDANLFNKDKNYTGITVTNLKYWLQQLSLAIEVELFSIYVVEKILFYFCTHKIENQKPILEITEVKILGSYVPLYSEIKYEIVGKYNDTSFHRICSHSEAYNNLHGSIVGKNEGMLSEDVYKKKFHTKFPDKMSGVGIESWLVNFAAVINDRLVSMEIRSKIRKFLFQKQS